MQSIRQPWAWAVFHAGKGEENRNRSASFRGPVCVHAAMIDALMRRERGRQKAGKTRATRTSTTGAGPRPQERTTMTDKIGDFTDLITAGEANAPDPALRAPAVLAELSAIIGQEARLGKKSTRVPGKQVTVRGSSAEFNVAGVYEAVVGAGCRLNTRSEDRQFADVWFEIRCGDGE
ncbi:ASCH domain-containing protein [Paenirhodobacter ferrireducens]|nr:hypothetical protein [Sinirhodobacter ferrireducens]